MKTATKSVKNGRIWDGARCKEARRAAGLKQIDAADRLEITAEFLSSVEAGRDHPGAGLICEMASLYNCTIFDLADKKFLTKSKKIEG